MEEKNRLSLALPAIEPNPLHMEELARVSAANRGGAALAKRRKPLRYLLAAGVVMGASAVGFTVTTDQGTQLYGESQTLDCTEADCSSALAEGGAESFSNDSGYTSRYDEPGVVKPPEPSDLAPPGSVKEETAQDSFTCSQFSFTPVLYALCEIRQHWR